jgi:hypothetical protein
MLYEKHFVEFCKQNNVDVCKFFDNFLEQQIARNNNPETHKMLLEMYAENWFTNLMGNAGKRIGGTVNAVSQGAQNFKQQYNQATQPTGADPIFQAVKQAKELLSKVGLYDSHFKDAFEKLKKDMTSKQPDDPTTPPPPTPTPTPSPTPPATI